MTTYLDHAATTPMRDVAVEAFTRAARQGGNASSLHTSGRAARALVEESRERIAGALGARPSEVVFTSGGTEADNLAVKGTYAARRAADPGVDAVVASTMEHHAVLDPIAHLVEGGARALWLDPDTCGHIGASTLRETLEGEAGRVALVSVMWANNEVGTVQPVADLAAIAHEFGATFHSDAVQAVGYLPVNFGESGADLLTVSAHKVGGPVGIGALLARRDATLVPLVHGGGQERQVRSGTLDAAGIAAFAAALDEAVAEREDEAARLLALRDRLLAGARALDPDVTITGCWTPGDAQGRLANNAHILIPGAQGDSMLYLFDAHGIEVSTGSACQAGVPQPSHVVLAMGYDEAAARGALRISFGHTSREADVDAFLAALPDVIDRSRRASGAA